MADAVEGFETMTSVKTKKKISIFFNMELSSEEWDEWTELAIVAMYFAPQSHYMTVEEL